MQRSGLVCMLAIRLAPSDLHHRGSCTGYTTPDNDKPNLDFLFMHENPPCHDIPFTEIYSMGHSPVAHVSAV